MHRFTSFIRRPVKRQGAEQYVLVTLVSFAASVTLTRLFLAVTGYPQIASGDLHIAHALWGGLLLYVASLLPLIIANRWVYMAGAILAGTGVGLFIDEVGKFITQTNDYFYPLAAPIVYAFFLLSVMLYLRVRRPPSRSPRAELYRALDALEEVLEQDLDEAERAELEARLRYIAERSDQPDLTRLANDLIDFLHHESMALAPRRPGVVEKAIQRWKDFEAQWVTRVRLKRVLAAGLFGLGLLTLLRAGLVLGLLAVIPLAAAPPDPDSSVALERLGELLRRMAADMPSGLFWYTDLALETSVSLLLLVSAGLLVAGKDILGTGFAYAGLLLSLTAVNLLVFYFGQFSSILTAMVQLGLLVGVAYYRQKYMERVRS